MHRFSVICLCITLVWAVPFQKSPKKQFLENINGRIVGGEKARDGQFPWQVAIRVSSRNGNWFCGGTIIDEQWILTAGHCVDGGETAVITAGVVQLTDNAAVKAESNELIPHEDYDDQTLRHDIGLIRLTTPLEFGQNVRSIRISEEELVPNEGVIVSGWGLTSDDGTQVSEDLNWTTLYIISNQECQDGYKDDQIFDTMVCAVSHRQGVVRSPCNGDSGGPVLLIEGVEGEERQPELAAVISFVSDEGCESDVPSGYVRIAPYLDWIRETTQSRTI